MGQTAKALGVGATFEFEGREYTLAPLTYRKLAKFSVWLVERARKAARRAGKVIAADEVDRLQNLITRDEAAGHYEPFGRIFCESESSPEGQRQIMRLMLEDGALDLDEMLLLKMWADCAPPESAAGEPGESKRAEILRKVREVNSDPKAMKAMLIPM